MRATAAGAPGETTVLHVLDHSLPTVSGYSTRSRSIVVFQRALGLRPVVVTSPKHPAPGPPCEVLDGVPHYRTPGGRRPGRRVPGAAEVVLMARLARRLREVARAEGARLIHAHSPVLNGLPALLVGRCLGLPVVYEARAFWEDAAVDHGTTREGSLRYRLSRALETFVFRQADRAVVIAEAMAAELRRRGVPAERIVVVPNGVDAEHFAPVARSQALARALGLDDGPVLGFIGSFYRYEGLRLLVEAVPELRRRVPGLRVLLVGGGEEDALLRRQLAPPDAGAVVFAGRVPHDRIREYYSVIDVFVCPRRRMRLTDLVTPLKPLEAMAMERAVLASDVGGHRELIRDGVTGVLFAADSRPALADAAVRLAVDPAARGRLGADARSFAAAERGWRQVVGRYVATYRAVA
jgi:PEP-CTERM/exosortase A-associated glycosyltransferase